MTYIRERVATQINTYIIAQFLVLAGTATLLPFFIHIQWITGPIINAILIIILFLVGIRSALVICLVPSLIALASGLLPAILAPVVPFIMIGNVILVLCVDWFYNNSSDKAKGYGLGIFVGSGFKFLFLFASVNVAAKLLIKQELTVKIVQIMSWPQFATAVTGGMIAWAVLKWLKKI